MYKVKNSVLIFLAVFVSVQTVSEYLYRSSDGTIYDFHPECRVYLDAKHACERDGSHLAILNSDEEAALLANLLQRYQDILYCESELYLGVHYDSAANGFLTLHGHTLNDAGYAKWAKGEPNNRTTYSMLGEQCVSMFRSKELNDLVCGQFRPFVCEISGYAHRNGSHYKTHSTAVKPTQAARICQAHGGHLVIIDDPEEAKIIAEIMPTIYASARMFGIKNPYAVVGRHYSELTSSKSTSSISKETFNNIDHISQNIKNNTCIGVNSTGGVVSIDCHLYSRTTGSLYRFHRECRTYAVARQTCQDEGGELVIVNSEEEADELEKLFKRNPDHMMRDCSDGEYRSEFFIGVHYDPEKLDFMTLDGNTMQEAGYVNWRKGEPNNLTVHVSEGEQCVTMFRNKELNDLHCGKTRVFVCEIYGYVYNEASDSIYKVNTQKTSWFEAIRRCERQGGHLAIIDNDEEAQIIGKLVLHYLDKKPTSSGAFVKTNGNGACNVVQGGGSLTNVNCAEDRPYICEIERNLQQFVEFGENTKIIPADINVVMREETKSNKIYSLSLPQNTP